MNKKETKISKKIYFCQYLSSRDDTHSAITSSKLAKETLEQGVKYVQS